MNIRAKNAAEALVKPFQTSRFARNTRIFRTDKSFATIIGAIIGAALGMIIGMKLGAPGVISGLAVGTLAGAKCGLWYARKKDPVLQLINTAFRN